MSPVSTTISATSTSLPSAPALTPAAPPRIAEAPPAASQRRRRAYDVWERATLPDVERGEQWSTVAVSVDATSRSAALKQATDGRAGTFATVLVGEWVEEVVEDPQGALVDALTEHLAEVPPDASASELREAVRAAVEAAGGTQ